MVQLKDAIKPASPNKTKKTRRLTFCEGIKRCCLDRDEGQVKDLDCENSWILKGTESDGDTLP